MHGLKTLARLNADNAEADRIVAAHETRVPCGAPNPRDILLAVTPDAGEAVLAPCSLRGLQWLQTRYPDRPHNGLAVVITNPDDIASAAADAEAAGLRVN